MYSLRTHAVINQMVSLFRLTGLWHQNEMPKTRELCVKWAYCIFFSLFLPSLAFGSITNANTDEKIFLAEISVIVVVLSVNFWVLIWKQNQILELLSRVATFAIKDDEDVTILNTKIELFMRFLKAFLIAVTATSCATVLVTPFLGDNKTLFLKIAFPLDWRNSEAAFWTANIFLLAELLLSMTSITFSGIIWYLLLICSLRYQAIGYELKRLGHIDEYANEVILENHRQQIYVDNLKTSIKDHIRWRKTLDNLETFGSKLFFVQIGSSGLCICGSIYCLAFNLSQNIVELVIHLCTLFHNISEIFMITYFGNEIMVSSDRLSYCLFESKWVDQPQSTKKLLIIFGEYLKQPQTLVVGKLYPLNLDTFTRILKSAYSMLNLLKSLKK